jgi:hypothetical protein
VDPEFLGRTLVEHREKFRVRSAWPSFSSFPAPDHICVDSQISLAATASQFTELLCNITQ